MAVGRPGAPRGGGRAGGGRAGGAPAQEAVDADWAAAGTVGSSPRLQAAVSRALALLLWSALVVALVLGLVNCAGAFPAAPADEGDGDGQGDTALVSPPGGCAELVVSGWLAGDNELLAEVPGLPRSDPEPGRRRAIDTFTAAVTPGEGAWGYLIGATVQVRERDGDDAGEDPAGAWLPAGVQFFRVTMVPSDSGGCQGWAPAALPAQVPAPALGGDSATEYDATLPASDTELSETLHAFFSGMLTGGESLERYVAPGVHIPTLTPPPYEQVSVVELQAREELEAGVPPDGTVLQLLATVSTDADDLPLVYPVTVAVRGGRWEVVSLDPLVGTSVLPEASGAASSAASGAAAGAVAEAGAVERAAATNSADQPRPADRAGAGEPTNGG